MPDWGKHQQLGPRQSADPVMWRSVWPDDLPVVSDEDMLAIQGEGTSSRVFTYGHTGSKKDGTVPHFISTRGGYKMHTDEGFVRFTHQVVLRNDGFCVVGLSGEAGAVQVPGTMYCLDTWSPHAVLPDARCTTGLYKLQAAVDAPEPLPPEAVIKLLRPLLSDPRAHVTKAST